MKKIYTTLQSKIKSRPWLQLSIWVIVFYSLMLAIILFVLMHDFQQIPKDIYSSF